MKLIKYLLFIIFLVISLIFIINLMEENDENLAQKHCLALNSFAPDFIPSVLDGENILFADDEHRQRVNSGLQAFLSMGK